MNAIFAVLIIFGLFCIFGMFVIPRIRKNIAKKEFLKTGNIKGLSIEVATDPDVMSVILDPNKLKDIQEKYDKDQSLEKKRKQREDNLNKLI